MTAPLPDYAARLDALHRGLEDEFHSLVSRLPLSPSDTVVDVGCGDGFFTSLLIERLPLGQSIALDHSPAFLDAARKRLRDSIAAGRCRVATGDALALPFERGQLDDVWSAHSMQSYDSIPDVLAEFRRVLKPGGLLGILESDAMHSIMLPWPPRLEAAIRHAEWRSLGDADDKIGAYFPRYATALLREAGFEHIEKHHALVHRPGPLRDPIHGYVKMYLDELLERTQEHLDESMRRPLDEWRGQWAQPHEDRYFSSLQVLITARAPST